MDALPNEIHHKIASFLATSDVRSYRLLGKRYADIGTELLYSTFDIYYDGNESCECDRCSRPPRRALERIDHLTSQPHLIKQVKHITVGDTDTECFDYASPRKLRRAIHTFAAAGCNIQSMQIDTGVNWGNQIDAYAGILAASVSVVPNITRFEYRSEQNRHTEHAQSCFQKFLGSLKKLKHLSLELPTGKDTWNDFFGPMYRLGPMVTPEVFSRLHTLELINLRSTQSELIQLLTQLSSHTKSLSLTGVVLLPGGQWINILQAIHDAGTRFGLLHLEELETVNPTDYTKNPIRTLDEFQIINNRLSAQNMMDLKNMIDHVNTGKHWKGFQTIADVGGTTHAGFPYEVHPDAWDNFYSFEGQLDRDHFQPEGWTDHQLDMIREMFASLHV